MSMQAVGITVLACLLGASATTKDADDVYTIHGPERTSEAIEATYAEMPRVEYEPPKDRWGGCRAWRRSCGRARESYAS